MVLADGMGSGERADQESKGLVEALENMLEAGLEKRSAIRMLNTLLVAGYEGKSFTALDMASIDLYTGVCEIVKNGAAPTFIKRETGVETITASALPVGVVMEEEGEARRIKLKGGDMIIMVSDGVIDGYCGESGERQEEALEQLIGGLPCQNPTDMANQILMHALARSNREAADDMSVLVAGIWDKV